MLKLFGVPVNFLRVEEPSDGFVSVGGIVGVFPQSDADSVLDILGWGDLDSLYRAVGNVHLGPAGGASLLVGRYSVVGPANRMTAPVLLVLGCRLVRYGSRARVP